MAELKAMVFDLQGTLVDFFEPLMRRGAEINRETGLALDWAALSVGWRELYRQSMDAIISGERDWRRVDAIYREALDAMLERAGIADRFSADERDVLNGFWTHLDPWPDSVAGLTRLRSRYITAPLTNAAMWAAIAVVKHAGLPFDAVLSAELVRSYKPAEAVYRLAPTLLGVAPTEIMLVACHKYDLRAGKAFGFRTAFVARPLEFGPDARPDVEPDPSFDFNVGDLHELADRLGC